MSDIQSIVIGFIQGFLSSSVFILALFIGFCVLVGFTKTKRTAGNAPVVKNLDEALTWARKAAVACRAPVEVRQFLADS